ncbi:MAG: glycosyltransferase family 4 protein [Paludibacter sp.]|nr:glycosyltransferase family 4 protein [Paludibacter sp.]
MHIIIFTHPTFINSQSMPRYAHMLEAGMKKRGNTVELWSASPLFFKLPFPAVMKKWLGYIDQFVVFPLQLKRKLKKCDENNLFVFSDHALGPWVPLVADRKHVIHCHDFLAQQSALGEIKENKVSFSGRMYQMYIRWGYRKGKNFISISKKTQADLHHLLGSIPAFSEVVYNGLNQQFSASDPEAVRQTLQKEFCMDVSNGYILHVGGNQFYKNRKGVLKIYTAWRNINKIGLPLLMIGEEPTEELKQLKINSLFDTDIYFHTTVNDAILQLAYQGATLLLFPSLAEGFGWPIAEAMASGCPVITTNEAPMTEVGGNAAYYISKRPTDNIVLEKWATDSAIVVNKLVELSKNERQKLIDLSIENAKRFDTKKALDQMEEIYKTVLEKVQR